MVAMALNISVFLSSSCNLRFYVTGVCDFVIMVFCILCTRQHLHSMLVPTSAAAAFSDHTSCYTIVLSIRLHP
jgi:hypothetical protein